MNRSASKIGLLAFAAVLAACQSKVQPPTSDAPTGGQTDIQKNAPPVDPADQSAAQNDTGKNNQSPSPSPAGEEQDVDPGNGGSKPRPEAPQPHDSGGPDDVVLEVPPVINGLLNYAPSNMGDMAGANYVMRALKISYGNFNQVGTSASFKMTGGVYMSR